MDHQDDLENELDEQAEVQSQWRRWILRAFLAVVLLLAGAAGGAVWNEWRAAKTVSRPADGSPTATPSSMPHPTGQSQPPGTPKADEPVEVSLTSDAVARAGIKIATARTERVAQTITVPGTVTSNAYRDTKVAALVGGVVKQVLVELGTGVERGQPLAMIFSQELAEAQMKYLSMRAMLNADHQKLTRTEKLVALGAASRQELEEVAAIYAAHEAEVASARERLLLLGLTPAQIDRLRSAGDVVSDVTVPAPVAGVIIARTVNPGQVVMQGHELFVVTDLSSVWVIGDVYEKDFGNVRVGTEASITVPAAPSRRLSGRVSYIEPRVDPATRTAKVRIEVPNPGAELRLGMYVTVSFRAGTEPAVTVVPRAAVQAIGERTVVYVPLDDGEERFAERSVKLGRAVGDFVEVLQGLKAGERVVTEGSFFLRAEATRARSGG